jgi:hypothetical protein
MPATRKPVVGPAEEGTKMILIPAQWSSLSEWRESSEKDNTVFSSETGGRRREEVAKRERESVFQQRTTTGEKLLVETPHIPTSNKLHAASSFPKTYTESQYRSALSSQQDPRQ